MLTVNRTAVIAMALVAWLGLAAVLVPPASGQTSNEGLATSTTVVPNVALANGFLRFGVNPNGSLIDATTGLAFDPTGSGAYNPDVLTPGGPYEGYGVSFVLNGTLTEGSGQPGSFPFGTAVTPFSFSSTATTADALTTLGPLTIRHQFSLLPGRPTLLVRVTLTNTGTAPIFSLAYSRQADFDITAGFVDEFLTLTPGVPLSVLGAPATVVRARGLAGPNQVFGLAGASPESVTFANFPPNGPFDPTPIPAPVPAGVPQSLDGIASLYFDLGTLAPGQSVTFNLAYAAGVNDSALQAALAGALLTLSPPSGDYAQTQRFDLVVVIEGLTTAVTGATATFDGIDVLAALAGGCDTTGTLVGGGITLRCPGLGGGVPAPGTHTLSVQLNLADGTTIGDTVTWRIRANSEP